VRIVADHLIEEASFRNLGLTKHEIWKFSSGSLDDPEGEAESNFTGAFTGAKTPSKKVMPNHSMLLSACTRVAYTYSPASHLGE